MVRGRTVFPDILAELQLAELSDNDRPQEKADQECGQTGVNRSESDIPEDIESRNAGVQRV
jgi:hypothetical protein